MNVDSIQSLVEEDGIVFLTYGGFLTQTLITGMTEALEQEAENNELNMGVANNIFTIFIELSQNIMNYSKAKSPECNDQKSEGIILVTKDEDNYYYIHSQNIIDIEDKQKIEPKLEEIASLDRNGIKQRYKELRRSGKNTHGKGGGIGFYEISKRSDSIKYEFKNINNNRYYFHFVAKVNTNKEK